MWCALSSNNMVPVTNNPWFIHVDGRSEWFLLTSRWWCDSQQLWYTLDSEKVSLRLVHKGGCIFQVRAWIMISLGKLANDHVYQFIFSIENILKTSTAISGCGEWNQNWNDCIYLRTFVSTLISSTQAQGQTSEFNQRFVQYLVKPAAWTETHFLVIMWHLVSVSLVSPCKSSHMHSVSELCRARKSETSFSVGPRIRVKNVKSVDLPAIARWRMPPFLACAHLEVVSLASRETPKLHPNLEFIPPVPHLLTSNEPPSDAERSLIQDAIEDMSARQVLDPDPALEFIRLHRSALSTFRRFPNEIIGYIICQYSESDLVSESTLVMDSYGIASCALSRHLRFANPGDRFPYPFLICGHISPLTLQCGNCRSANPPSPFWGFLSLSFIAHVMHRFRSLFIIIVELHKVSMPLHIFSQPILPDGGHCALSLPGHF